MIVALLVLILFGLLLSFGFSSLTTKHTALYYNVHQEDSLSDLGAKGPSFPFLISSEDVTLIESKLHIAKLDPSSGPLEGGTVVRVSGIGFMSSLAEVEKLLSLKRVSRNNDSSKRSLYRKGDAVGKGSPNSPLLDGLRTLGGNIDDDVVERSNNQEKSQFDIKLLREISSREYIPKAFVHIDVIDGKYYTILPDVLSDTELTFIMPSVLGRDGLFEGESGSGRDIMSDERLKKNNSVETKRRDNQDLSIEKKSTIDSLGKSHSFALISVHLFNSTIYHDKNPLTFKFYPPPSITQIHPHTLRLSGGEDVYLFGNNIFASDIIKVKVSSADRSKILDCQFVMGVPPQITDVSDELKAVSPVLRKPDLNKEQPAVLCESPSWTKEDFVEVHISFNGQQFSRVMAPGGRGGGYELMYKDESSLLGDVAKAVVERPKDEQGKGEDGLGDVGKLGGKNDFAVEGGNEWVDKGAAENKGKSNDVAVLKVVDEKKESESKLKVESGPLLSPPKSVNVNDTNPVDSVGDGDQPPRHAVGTPLPVGPWVNVEVEAPPPVTDASLGHPKGLPNFQRKKKDLMSIHLLDSDNNSYVLSRPADPQSLRHDIRLVVDITIMLVTAALGGLISEALYQPVVLGQLVAGVIVGPKALNFIQQLVQVTSMAQFGSAFILFELGLHFSPQKILKVRHGALWCGLISNFCFVILFVHIALFMGTSISEGVVIGAFLSMSSTALCSKDITARHAGEIHESDVTIGILLVQDILLGLVLALMPAFSTTTEVLSLLDRILVVVKPFVNLLFLLFVCMLVALLLLPGAVSYINQWRSREVYILSCVAFILGVGAVTEHFELSLELGSFIAGLMLTRLSKNLKLRTADLMSTLRDLWAGLFFASIGLILDPIFVWDNFSEILYVLGLLVVVKFTVFLALLLVARYHISTAVRVALTLSHLGEFGFVIIGKAASLGLVVRKVHLLLLGTTGMSLLCTPLLLRIVGYLPYGVNSHTPPIKEPFVDLFNCGFCRCRALDKIIQIYRKLESMTRHTPSFPSYESLSTSAPSGTSQSQRRKSSVTSISSTTTSEGEKRGACGAEMRWPGVELVISNKTRTGDSHSNSTCEGSTSSNPPFFDYLDVSAAGKITINQGDVKGIYKSKFDSHTSIPPCVGDSLGLHRDEGEDDGRHHMTRRSNNHPPDWRESLNDVSLEVAPLRNSRGLVFGVQTQDNE